MACEHLTLFLRKNHLVIEPSPSEASDFLSRIVINNETGCWDWHSTIDADGYGRFRYRKKSVTVHRFIYAWIIAPLPSGNGGGLPQIDHLCRNRKCCNLSHLELVPARTNTLRSNSVTAINARKTHCIKGHEYTEENTYRSKMGRHCEICRKASSATPEQRAKRREYYFQHRVLKGKAQGERQHLAKLTAPQVIAMREIHATKGIGAYRLAKMYGVSKPCANAILKRKTWKHV